MIIKNNTIKTSTIIYISMIMLSTMIGFTQGYKDGAIVKQRTEKEIVSEYLNENWKLEY